MHRWISEVPHHPSWKVDREKHVEATSKQPKNKGSIERKEEAILGSGGTINLVGLAEDVEALLRYREDGTVEVHKWVADAPQHAFLGLAQICQEGRLEREDLPGWPRKATAEVWSQMLQDREARNYFMKSIMWRSTDVLRHVVGEVEEGGAITFTHACEHCKCSSWRASCGRYQPW